MNGNLQQNPHPWPSPATCPGHAWPEARMLPRQDSIRLPGYQVHTPQRLEAGSWPNSRNPGETEIDRGFEFRKDPASDAWRYNQNPKSPDPFSHPSFDLGQSQQRTSMAGHTPNFEPESSWAQSKPRVLPHQSSFLPSETIASSSSTSFCLPQAGRDILREDPSSPSASCDYTISSDEAFARSVQQLWDSEMLSVGSTSGISPPVFDMPASELDCLRPLQYPRDLYSAGGSRNPKSSSAAGAFTDNFRAHESQADTSEFGPASSDNWGSSLSNSTGGYKSTPGHHALRGAVTAIEAPSTSPLNTDMFRGFDEPASDLSSLGAEPHYDGDQQLRALQKYVTAMRQIQCARCRGYTVLAMHDIAIMTRRWVSGSGKTISPVTIALENACLCLLRNCYPWKLT
jgi:hypothetical protein